MLKKQLQAGEKYGRLTILGCAGKTDYEFKHFNWLCKCECGSITTIRGTFLRTGKIIECRTCAINRRAKAGQKHGMYGTPEYYAWRSMIDRCHVETCANYRNYGARGISVCKKWRYSFVAFFKDMGFRPSSDMSLERIDNNRGYYKLNCRWATAKEQAYNRRTTVYIEYNGVRMILADWARKLNTGATSIKQMLKRGKSFSEVHDYYYRPEATRRQEEVRKLYEAGKLNQPE